MVDNNYLLTCDQHQVNSALTLRNIWEEEEFLDVTLACDDGQIAAHKVIISSASPFFRNILKRNPHSHPLLYIKGATKNYMQIILNFIYSGEAAVNEEDLNKFIALANSLEVRGLATDDGEEMQNEEVPEISERLFKPKSGAPFKNKSKKRDCLVKDQSSIKFEQPEEVPKDSSVVENEEMDSFLIQDLSNTSMTDYHEKVTELMAKNGSSWDCLKCEYTVKHRGHLKEHVQKHIEGYTFNCETCTRTFSSKNLLRHHTRRCKSPALNALRSSNLKSTGTENMTID